MRQGETARFSFAVENAAGPQVVHVELVRPDGKSPWRFRRNIRTDTGDGVYAFETAFNEMPGNWKAVFVHVNTGTRTERPFTVKAE